MRHFQDSVFKIDYLCCPIHRDRPLIRFIYKLLKKSLAMWMPQLKSLEFFSICEYHLILHIKFPANMGLNKCFGKHISHISEKSIEESSVDCTLNIAMSWFFLFQVGLWCVWLYWTCISIDISLKRHVPYSQRPNFTELYWRSPQASC